jgi:CRP-like cAMP-binding protein/predicted MFS family arabinose efflux permease
MPRSREKSGFSAALQSGDFRLLLASLATSGIGDWFYNVALIVLVLEQTASASWVATASIARLAPYVAFGAVAGALADRYDRRRVMIATDVARGLLMFALTAAASLSAPAGVAVAIAFFSTAAGTPFLPAAAALTPEIVEERRLAAANGLITSIDSLAVVFGPALGGIVLLAGPPSVAFLVNGLTFLASALMVARISAPRASAPPQDSATLRSRLLEGVNAMRASPGVVSVVVLAVVASFTYGAETVLYPLVARDFLGIGAEGVGFLYAAVGAGGLAAAGLTDRAAARPRSSPVLLGSSLAAAVPIAAIAVTRDPTFAYGLVAVEGASFVLADVVGTTVLQRALPPEVTARVFGLLDSLTVAGTVTGALIAPVVLDAFGLSTALVATGVVMASVTLAGAPGLQGIDRRAARRAHRLDEIVSALWSLDIFTGMSRASLESLAAAAQRQTVEGGAIVVSEGDPADDFFVVLSGSLEVRSKGESGQQERTVAEMRKGDYFGEIGLIERMPRTASVVALSTCELLRIPGDQFLAAVGALPTASGPLSRRVVARLGRTHPSRRPFVVHSRST